MTRYFFDSLGRTFNSDNIGTELSDLDSAKAAAIQVLTELLHHNAEDFWATGQWTLTVSNEDRLHLFAIEMVATLSPAVSFSAHRPR